VPSDFHLFGLLKEALEGKGFRTDSEVKRFVRRFLEEQPKTFLKRA
jgi:hypothetical protein